MKILVACEYSGTVRTAFEKHGHDVMSCDLLPTDIKGNHYQGDVRDILNDGWDMLIAHPPCQYLATSGARWMKDPQRQKKQRDALLFVQLLMYANIPKICIENPVSVISSKIRKPDQIIQPYWFGDQARKSTCLWLKNLPYLKPTNVVDQGEVSISQSGKRFPKWMTSLNAHDRAKTFQGIANAMAAQWSVKLLTQMTMFTGIK